MDQNARRPSPFSDLLGNEVIEWHDGFARIGLVLRPHHLNRGGIVHGGVLMSLLDDCGAAAGVWSDPPGQRRSVTVTLTCQFTGRAREGRLIGSASVVSHGRSTYFSRSEVHDETGQLLAFGSSTHRWLG